MKPMLLALLLAASVGAQTGCEVFREEDFTRVTLLSQLNEPMEAEFLPDGRILVIEKVTGKLLLLKPNATTASIALRLDVSTAGNRADGLLGLEPDPGFATNRWLYLYYSPKGGEAVNVISRFTLNGDKVDSASEKRIFVVPTHRRHCCHSSGDLDFGPDGNLYLSTGDNAGVTSGVVNTEAEGTSGNTNDLRGKLLRIRPRPLADGAAAPAPGPGSTYDIPAGNLFPAGTAKTRPEIFAMGLRNPFRFGIDRKTGWILSGDVGPDAQSDWDEFNLMKTAGNYGWPWFVGDNQAYTVGGRPAVAAAPVNASPLNTGLGTLPPARGPAFWYGYSGTTRFPGFNLGGRVASAGDRYHYDAAATSRTRLPPAFDGKWLLWDWRQRWMRAASLDAQGAVTGFLDLFPAQLKREEVARLTDLRVGADGNLYALQYGWVDYQPSTQGALYRFEYRRPECHTGPSGTRSSRGVRASSQGGSSWPGPGRGLLPHPRAGGWDVLDLQGRRRNPA